MNEYDRQMLASEREDEAYRIKQNADQASQERTIIILLLYGVLISTLILFFIL